MKISVKITIQQKYCLRSDEGQEAGSNARKSDNNNNKQNKSSLILPHKQANNNQLAEWKNEIRTLFITLRIRPYG